jgi:hypothetical protein
MVKLFQLKASNGWSDNSFKDLLTLLKDMLPQRNAVPETIYEAKHIICLLGLEVKKNPCMQKWLHSILWGWVYPHLTILDDIPIDSAHYAVVKVDMVHENMRNLKLEVPLGDMTLTLWDAVARRGQWSRSATDVDPAATSTSTPPSQPQTTATLIPAEAQLDSPI